MWRRRPCDKWRVRCLHLTTQIRLAAIRSVSAIPARACEHSKRWAKEKPSQNTASRWRGTRQTWRGRGGWGGGNRRIRSEGTSLRICAFARLNQWEWGGRGTSHVHFFFFYVLLAESRHASPRALGFLKTPWPWSAGNANKWAQCIIKAPHVRQHWALGGQRAETPRSPGCLLWDLLQTCKLHQLANWKATPPLHPPPPHPPRSALVHQAAIKAAEGSLGRRLFAYCTNSFALNIHFWTTSIFTLNVIVFSLLVASLMCVCTAVT